MAESDLKFVEEAFRRGGTERGDEVMALSRFHKYAEEAAKGIFPDPSGGSLGQNTRIIEDEMRKAYAAEIERIAELLADKEALEVELKDLRAEIREQS